jgi:hypothetical protein
MARKRGQQIPLPSHERARRQGTGDDGFKEAPPEEFAVPPPAPVNVKWFLIILAAIAFAFMVLMGIAGR